MSRSVGPFLPFSEHTSSRDDGDPLGIGFCHPTVFFVIASSSFEGM